MQFLWHIFIFRWKETFEETTKTLQKEVKKLQEENWALMIDNHKLKYMREKAQNGANSIYITVPEK